MTGKAVPVRQKRSGSTIAPHLQGKAAATGPAPADVPIVTLVGQPVGF
jgi:hypothetical protein